MIRKGPTDKVAIGSWVIPISTLSVGPFRIIHDKNNQLPSIVNVGCIYTTTNMLSGGSLLDVDVTMMTISL
jgi:hypothetical protein